MNKVSVKPTAQPQLFDAYSEMFRRLLDEPAAFRFYDRQLQIVGQCGKVPDAATSRWLRGLDLPGVRSAVAMPHETQLDAQHFLVALELRDSKGRFLGAVVVQLESRAWRKLGSNAATVIGTRLQPGLHILHRELAVQAKPSAQVLSERTQELEWLFGLTTRLGDNGSGEESLKRLLAAACEHIDAGFGAIVIPEKRVTITHGTGTGTVLNEIFTQTSGHLLNWVQRRERPLIVNAPPPSATRTQTCRMIAIPIVQRAGRVIGLLAFFNPPEAKEFVSRHTFLGRHLGRQIAAQLESQFDLATGLYTRAALEQHFGKTFPLDACPKGCVIYVDIDRLHVVNELHGFEIGDEVIVRIADLLAPPLVPQNVLAARMSGDRFAIVLTDADTDTALAVAMAIQGAAAQIRIGMSMRPAIQA